MVRHVPQARVAVARIAPSRINAVANQTEEFITEMEHPAILIYVVVHTKVRVALGLIVRLSLQKLVQHQLEFTKEITFLATQTRVLVVAQYLLLVLLTSLEQDIQVNPTSAPSHSLVQGVHLVIMNWLTVFADSLLTQIFGHGLILIRVILITMAVVREVILLVGVEFTRSTPIFALIALDTVRQTLAVEDTLNLRA